MKRTTILLAVLLLTAPLVVTACGPSDADVREQHPYHAAARASSSVEEARNQ